MQIKIHLKSIIGLFCLLLLNNAIVAQEKVTEYYITKDGIKTPIVFEPFNLASEKSKFLYEKTVNTEKNSRYDKLKDAMSETDQVFDMIDTIQRRSTDSKGNFSLDGAKKNIELLQNEKSIKSKKSTSSLDELIFLKEKYGDSPSFFINDIEVTKEVFNKVSDREILTRELVVQNTISGNPNGEIRLLVSERTLQRIGIEAFKDEDPIVNINSYAFTNPIETKETKTKDRVEENDVNSQSEENDLDKLLQQIMQLDATSTTTNKAIPSVDKTKIQSNKNQKTRPQKQVVATKAKEVVYSYDEMNRRTQKQETTVTPINEEEVFTVRSSDWKKVETQTAQPEKEEKRSVRDIKNRERTK